MPEPMDQCVTVTEAKFLGEYSLELVFSDGKRGTVDLKSRIVGRGGIYQPLENPEFFRQVHVNNDSGTVEWPNGLDICPDLLYSMITDGTVERPSQSAA